MKNLLLLLLSLTCLNTYSQEGELDFSFNGSGKILYENSNFAEGRTVLVQPDGKIVLGGYIHYNQGDILIARFDRNGNPDVTFGNQGFAYIDLNTEWQQATSIQLLGNGKLMVLAETDHQGERGCALLRLTANGYLDQSFADSGWVFNGVGTGNSYWNALVLLPNGDFVVGGDIYHAGGRKLALLGYHDDGNVNLSFGDTGIAIKAVGGATTELRALKLSPDGKLIAGGSTYFQGNRSFMLIKYEVDGKIDQSFAGGNGLSIGFNDNAELNDFCFQRDGKIIAAGLVERNNDDLFAMARVSPTGILDPGFGVNGKVETAIGKDSRAEFAGVLGDNRILLGGVGDGIWSEDYALARYNPDGTLDKSFSYDGISTKNIGPADDIVLAGTIQSDGKLILVGTSEKPSSSFSRYYLSVARFIGGVGSIGEVELEEPSLQIFPNPAHDIVQIESSENIQEIRIFDLSGKLIRRIQPNDFEVRLTVGDLPEGMLLLEIDVTGKLSIIDRLAIRR